jgi:hypothetical protein
MIIIEIVAAPDGIIPAAAIKSIKKKDLTGVTHINLKAPPLEYRQENLNKIAWLPINNEE